jgi:hypothetical protein
MTVANAPSDNFNNNGVHFLDRRPIEAASANDTAEEPPVGEPLDLADDRVLKVPNESATALPAIEAEPDGPIRVGAGGPLVVPREDLDADLDDSAEIDLLGGQPKIRKPHRREWIALLPESELRTRLLLDKPETDGIQTDYYYVNKELRGPIHTELKAVRVFLYYSFSTKSFGLWVVKITSGNSWYESLNKLFMQPREFFANNAILVASDRTTSCYRVRVKPLPSAVTWPEKPTQELLGEALGADHFITAADHPIYQELIDGTELS